MANLANSSHGKRMKIAVIGAGWVGVTTAATLASLGHTVVCTDINATRIKKLQSGQVPFFEPGLLELLSAGLQAKRLEFTTDNHTAITTAEVVFCCVNTPTDVSGVTDIKALNAVAKDFARSYAAQAVFVIKSTVPGGTAKKIHALITEAAAVSGKTSPFGMASNPEFLAESTAVTDALRPARIVIGTSDQASLQIMQQVYAPLIEAGVKLFACDCTTAEVIKTAANSFLATRVSFINQVANYCNVIGADPMLVAQGMSLDPRIGLMRPGVGYGGGCFPKDVLALLTETERVHTPMTVLQATHEANYAQRQMLYQRLRAALGEVTGKQVAILGVAFKPKTDDIRDAPALTFIENLLADGAQVIAYDPQVKANLTHDYPGLRWANSALQAVTGAQALVLMCEWQEFAELDMTEVKNLMSGQIVVDGRYVWSRHTLETLGFTYVV
jgi:UDPglucose 6-dehydrogenase